MSNLDFDFDEEEFSEDFSDDEWGEIFDEDEDDASTDEVSTDEPVGGEPVDEDTPVDEGSVDEDLSDEDEDEFDEEELESSADALAGEDSSEPEADNSVPDQLVDSLKIEGLEEKMSLDEAIRAMQNAESEIATHENAKIMLRWRQGVIVANTEIVRGEQTMEKLADQCGTHENTLRYCRKLVEFFNYDHGQFKDWVDEISDNNGKGYVRWSKDIIKGLLRGDEDPEVLGPEKFRDQAISRVESTVRSLEKLNEQIVESEDEDSDPYREVEGVTMKAMEEIRQFMQSQFYEDGTYDPQKTTPRSDQYLEWIRSMPSPLSGNPASLAHHLVRSGTSNKGSDFMAVPLTDKEHKELHNMDEDAFWNKYGFDPQSLAAAYMHLYLTGCQNGMIQVPTPDNGVNKAKHVSQDE